MKIKVLGAAVTAAMLVLSTGAFGQAGAGAGNSGPSAPSGSDSGVRTPGNTAAPVTDTTGSAAVGTSRDASVSTTHCDSLSGAEKTRCMRDARASTGSSNAGSTDGKRQVPGDTNPASKLGGKDSGGK